MAQPPTLTAEQAEQADPRNTRRATMQGRRTRSGCESSGPAWPACRGPAQPQPAPPDANHAVTALYLAHYRPLVRLAALLVRDLAAAEEIVQDAFVAVHAAWPRLPDADHALPYLRRSVIDRSRSVLRQHVVVDKLAPRLAPDLPSGTGEASIEVERSAFISA